MMKRIAFMLVVAPIVGAIISGAIVKAARPAERVIHITAKKFAFTPDTVTAKKGEPLVIEIKSEDVKHGFALPDFNVRASIEPGKTLTVRFTPDKAGQFTFACDIFCGDGHEDMSGTLTVTE
jgi:cytochrome c oxidase subunit II